MNQDRLPPPLLLPPHGLVVLLCRVAGPPLLAVAVVAVAVEAPADRDVGSAGRDGHEGARRKVDRGHAARPPPRGLRDGGTAPPPRAEAVASLVAGTVWGPSPPAAVGASGGSPVRHDAHATAVADQVGRPRDAGP